MMPSQHSLSSLIEKVPPVQWSAVQQAFAELLAGELAAGRSPLAELPYQLLLNAQVRQKQQRKRAAAALSRSTLCAPARPHLAPLRRHVEVFA